MKYHFIGIGGIGMSGLAHILLSRKMQVSGSDISSSYVTESLQKAGAKLFFGQSSSNVPPDAKVVFSTDIKSDNPEYTEAIRLNCPMLHRSDLLCELTRDYKNLAVAGTHGKTTTSSLLTAVLVEAQQDPSFAIGGVLLGPKTNARHGQGQYFVIEADESDGTFSKYSPFGAIITNIDLDHMNYFKDEATLIEAFHTFASKVESPKHLFWCGDDIRLKGLNLPGFSYGFHSECACRAFNVSQKEWQISFDLEFQGQTYRRILVNLVGVHNILNAAAVFGLSIVLGLEEKTIRHAFANFAGVKRRCEKKGVFKNAILLDDYAHHPTEIRTTLEGIRRAIGKRRLIAVFQPHRYSRTKDCLGTYKGCLSSANLVYLTDIYAAGEKQIDGISHDVVFNEIEQDSKVIYSPRHMLADLLSLELQPNDVLVTMGAGDITNLSSEMLKK